MEYVVDISIDIDSRCVDTALDLLDMFIRDYRVDYQLLEVLHRVREALLDASSFLSNHGVYDTVYLPITMSIDVKMALT